jgi:hypothetical protein
MQGYWAHEFSRDDRQHHSNTIASTRAAHAVLLKKAKTYAKPGTNVVLRLKEGDESWLTGKAASKVYQLGTRKSAAEKADDQHIINNEAKA